MSGGYATLGSLGVTSEITASSNQSLCSVCKNPIDEMIICDNDCGYVTCDNCPFDNNHPCSGDDSDDE